MKGWGDYGGRGSGGGSWWWWVGRGREGGFMTKV